MKIGIPKGLLNYRYLPFFQSFFCELGAELIVSENTNKHILNEGVKYCVDEACAPVKIFHGHVASIKDRCDMVVIPRIMQLKEREFICPKFCGMPEMIKNSIPNMPEITSTPIYATSKDKLFNWALQEGKKVTKSARKISNAFDEALLIQRAHHTGIKDEGYSLNIALAGHPYNIEDNFINMNLVKKLHELGIGIITEEFIPEDLINDEVANLFKRPFWTFARNSYGFTCHLALNKKVDGIIYVSSFACGIDSIVIDLIKHRIGDFPFLVLKLDEHTGDAGLETRLEAFFDMLERRCRFEDNFSSSR